MADLFATLLTEIQATIPHIGWRAIAAPAGSAFPPYVYTIGLGDTMDLPDLIVVGLSWELSHMLLATVIDFQQQHGALAVGSPLPKQISMALRIGAVHPAWRPTLTPIAGAIYQSQPWELHQLVWADMFGAFPDDPAFPADPNDPVHAQPLLDRWWSIAMR